MAAASGCHQGLQLESAASLRRRARPTFYRSKVLGSPALSRRRTAYGPRVRTRERNFGLISHGFASSRPRASRLTATSPDQVDEGRPKDTGPSKVQGHFPSLPSFPTQEPTHAPLSPPQQDPLHALALSLPPILAVGASLVLPLLWSCPALALSVQGSPGTTKASPSQGEAKAATGSTEAASASSSTGASAQAQEQATSDASAAASALEASRKAPEQVSGSPHSAAVTSSGLAAVALSPGLAPTPGALQNGERGDATAANAQGYAATVQEEGTAKPAARGQAEAGAAKAKGSKKAEYMSIEERNKWAQGVPAVSETIPYTSILELHAAGNLKHIIKLPDSVLQAHPERALVVLGDERVVRVVLPPLERDPKFWRAWGDARIDDVIMNAFSPPTAPPEMLPWGHWGPSLKFLEDIGLVRRGTEEAAPKKAASRADATAKAKSRQAAAPQKKQPQQQRRRREQEPAAARKEVSAAEQAQIDAKERIRQLEEARRTAERERRESERGIKRQKEERARAEREERQKWEREGREQRKREERERKEAGAEQRRRVQVAAEGADSEKWANTYKSMAQNEGVRFLMGIGFFFVFYYVVILGIKKRKKDYEDRVKLQQAAEEERRKLESWEDDMLELEAKEAEEEERRRSSQRVSAGPGEESAGLSGPQLTKEEEKSESMKAAKKFLKSGARVKRATKGKRMQRPTYLDLGDEVRFDDVAGLGEIRRELEEIVDFFQAADKYRRRGSKIPTGILLCGDPGCGKTLLAKAVAGEAGVNFFSVSASQFVEIFVGVGASRVRALYNEAQENAPAVVFIDELDAVGRQRGLTEGSGGQERDATLNQLLTCLDGFDGRGDVITIAATNRPDILDTALVRPGRFDRKIFIPKPSLRGRAQILQVHSRNKTMADDVDYDVVAEITDGMSGAELANVVDVSALKVLREGRTEITTDDLLEAAVLEEGGYPKAHPLSATRQRQLALNEAAQAVVAYNYSEFRNIQLITATPPMTEEKGEIRFKMDASKFRSNMLTVSTLQAYVTIQLAPMVADKMWNPPEEWCTIWADHVDAARKMARQLAINGLSAQAQDDRLYGWSVSMVKDSSRVEAIDQEASAILRQCQQKAEEILTRNRSFVNSLAGKLDSDKTIQKEEIIALAETFGAFDPEPQPLVDAVDEMRRLREAYATKG